MSGQEPTEMADAAVSFEEALSDLEQIVRRLDGPELELDEALALFEQGIRRLREAGRMLDAGQGRVEELSESAAGDLRVIGLTGDEATDRENAG